MIVRISTRVPTHLASLTALLLAQHLLCATASGQTVGAQDEPLRAAKPAWLDGAGRDMRLRVAGQVFDESAGAASGFKLTVTQQDRRGGRELPVEIEGNRFRFWFPVGDLRWSNIHLDAVSADGRKIARRSLPMIELRQAAIALTLKPPERLVEVKVVDDAKPVAGAFVTAEVAGAHFTAKSDERGVALFPMTNRDKLSRLTAWTDDFRIGGYFFNRQPPRDPAGKEHTIGLERCRDQVVRFVNADDLSPVPDLSFQLIVGTGPPDFQFPGYTPTARMKTNAKGEATYRWFPDWKKHGSYVEILDPRWVKAEKEEMVDGTFVVRVKKSRADERKRIAGRLEAPDGNVAGYFVEMWSFQGEEESRSDVLYAFTDETGRFEANYLPGSVYCIYVNDLRYVSNIIDLIPHDVAADKTNVPLLKMMPGEPVEISVSSGPSKRPLPFEYVNIETPHPFSWQENGKERRGRGRRGWSGITDAEGKVNTVALAGQLRVSIYTPEWRSEATADVKAGAGARVELHREIDVARKISGRLILPDGLQADPGGAVIEIASVDRETEQQLTIAADRNGLFEFESKASRIGIFARTKDLKATAIGIFDDLDGPAELPLKPASELRGRLLGNDDRPLKGHTVRVQFYMSVKANGAARPATSFRPAEITTETDAEGHYTLSGLPGEVTLRLSADSPNGPKEEGLSEQIKLIPGESPPLKISRLGKRDAEQ